jgi:Predicted sugar kinase
MKVGLIAKKTKEALETLKLIEDYFVKKKIEVFYDDELLDVLKKDKIMWNEKNLDFVIWLGGDGTLLLHVNKLVNYDAKLLGIKFGNIGFLCEIDPTNIQEKLDRILSGKFRIEKRRLIEFVYDKKRYML